MDVSYPEDGQNVILYQLSPNDIIHDKNS
jgi:hypothetical protein